MHPKVAVLAVASRGKHLARISPFSSSMNWFPHLAPPAKLQPQHGWNAGATVCCWGSLCPTSKPPKLALVSFAVVWVMTLLVPLRLLSCFSASLVLFRLCCDQENAVTLQVLNRDYTSMRFTPSWAHKEGNNCAGRDIAFSHAAVSSGQGWGEWGCLCTFISSDCSCHQPSPPWQHYSSTKEAGLEVTQLWGTGISSCFCKFTSMYPLPSCFHITKNLSWSKISWCSWTIPTVCCKRKFPLPFLFSHSSSVYLRAASEPSLSPSSPPSSP